jgi:N-formylglutamate amidohydrolase
MPALPKSRSDPSPAQIIIGNRFGRSSAIGIARCFAVAPRSRPVRTASNIPYAGGHIVETHGRPGANIHAVQIEFDRSLYLDDDGKPAADRTHEWGQWLVDCAEQAIAMTSYDMPLAAE